MGTGDAARAVTGCANMQEEPQIAQGVAFMEPASRPTRRGAGGRGSGSRGAGKAGADL